MLISRKGKYFHVFGCISKNFSKNIFWCLEKKKEKTNPRKISSTIAIRDRDLADPISRSTRREIATLIAISVKGKIAINCAILRRREIVPSIAIFTTIVELEIGVAWSSESAGDRRTDCSVSSPLARPCSLSLSLSLFPEMLWSENEGRKSFSGQRWKYWSTRSHFSENIIFRDSQTCGKGWKWFPEIIFTQNKCTRSLSLFHLKYPTPVWYFRFFFFVVSDLWLIMRFGSSLSNNNKYKKKN